MQIMFLGHRCFDGDELWKVMSTVQSSESVDILGDLKFLTSHTHKLLFLHSLRPLSHMAYMLRLPRRECEQKQLTVT